MIGEEEQNVTKAGTQQWNDGMPPALGRFVGMPSIQQHCRHAQKARQRCKNATRVLGSPESRFRNTGSQYVLAWAAVKARKYASISSNTRGSRNASTTVYSRTCFFARVSRSSSPTIQSRSMGDSHFACSARSGGYKIVSTPTTICGMPSNKNIHCHPLSPRHRTVSNQLARTEPTTDAAGTAA